MDSFARRIIYPPALHGASFSIAGNIAGVVKKCSGTEVPERRALVIRVMAFLVLGGTTTVAVNSPVRTQVWPVLGRPSYPCDGNAEPVITVGIDNGLLDGFPRPLAHDIVLGHD